MALEFELINWIKNQDREIGSDILTDIGDDMAIVQFGNEKLLITADMLLQGRHFDLDQTPLEDVGYKAMACSLSDCAAMASLPVAAIVSVALPTDMTMIQAQKLHAGIQKAAKSYNCPVIGGDTTSWPQPLAINITMFAKTDGIEPVMRSGAQTDDIIMVTGTLGGSLAGKHLNFQPRINEARQLAQMVKINAMMDISDGLAGDLPHICDQSKVSAIINAKDIPISDQGQKTKDPLIAALADGEDFELLFTVKPADCAKIQQNCSIQSQLQITPIGIIIEASEEKVYIRDGQETRPLTIKGFQHF
ncbi:MAG: thiamine-phosphate kinase [Phycisphaerae bacterium]|nr:thiamine-phosphate kinase [Phycisphaerae bacterium]